MQRKSLKVSCNLDIGRQKISSKINYKLILLIFALKELSFFFVLFKAENVMMMMMINFISVSGLLAGHVRPTNRGHYKIKILSALAN